jgi:hypothetical protein
MINQCERCLRLPFFRAGESSLQTATETTKVNSKTAVMTHFKDNLFKKCWKVLSSIACTTAYCPSAEIKDSS